MKIVIIGGGAAGASCAARLRRLDENAEIVILEKTQDVSIANCGLPYYVSDVIADRRQILVSSPQKFKSWFNIEVKLNAEVVSINKAAKNVILQNGEKIEYDKLVLTTGAAPIVPPFEGMEKQDVFVVRNLDDADKIKSYIVEQKVKKAVVIGGGFIGVEMAENLRELNIDTTLVELGTQILAPIDAEIAAVAQNEMRESGVTLILADGVDKFENKKIVLKSGAKLEFDAVIMAIGVRPEIKLAKDAGLAVNRGILVNEYMQTSDADIYAAGDNVEVEDFVSGENTLIPLAGPANRQGRIIADNICGYSSVYKKTLGSMVLKVFGLTVSAVGNNEKQLKQRNIPYLKTLIYGKSNAGYYPDACPILYKLLFSADGKILGAQGVGQRGVEKRIDVISSVMRNGGTVQELMESELCYAPPYASAKDAVNLLGMSADNIIKGLVKPAFSEDLQNAVLIDVRPKQVFAAETIKGASNLPISEIRERFAEIDRDKKTILFCNTGYTSYNAARILMQKGYDNVYSLMGGIEMYKEQIKNRS
ncbi:MAG: FAD-dependent oxidoreductase [Alphaproteobacteria bacterium]|nr:FAD-dependent oxidoreductase [Alphaproteobacteria bacterium]